MAPLRIPPILTIPSLDTAVLAAQRAGELEQLATIERQITTLERLPPADVPRYVVERRGSQIGASNVFHWVGFLAPGLLSSDGPATEDLLPRIVWARLRLGNIASTLAASLKPYPSPPDSSKVPEMSYPERVRGLLWSHWIALAIAGDKWRYNELHFGQEDLRQIAEHVASLHSRLSIVRDAWAAMGVDLGELRKICAVADYARRQRDPGTRLALIGDMRADRIRDVWHVDPTDSETQELQSLSTDIEALDQWLHACGKRITEWNFIVDELDDLDSVPNEADRTAMLFLPSDEHMRHAIAERWNRLAVLEARVSGVLLERVVALKLQLGSAAMRYVVQLADIGDSQSYSPNLACNHERESVRPFAVEFERKWSDLARLHWQALKTCATHTLNGAIHPSEYSLARYKDHVDSFYMRCCILTSKFQFAYKLALPEIQHLQQALTFEDRPREELADPREALAHLAQLPDLR